MKHLYTFAMMLMAALTANAEINPDYSAPTQLTVEYFEGHAHLYFIAPAEGGVVYAPEFSYDKGLDTMSQLGDGDTWNNGGNGQEITTAIFGGTMTGHAATLKTADFALNAGENYTLNFQAAGSRKSANQLLSVSLFRGETAVKEIVAPAELSASLMYVPMTGSFTVDESAEDYSLRFIFEASEKACGVNLKQIVLESPVPEGRGKLTGYAIWRDGVQVATFTVEEAVQDRLYLTLTDNDTLEPETTYEYALQALYEGGESPLTEAVTVDVPLPTAIGAVTLTTAAPAYDLNGRHTTTRGIQIINGVKIVK